MRPRYAPFRETFRETLARRRASPTLRVVITIPNEAPSLVKDAIARELSELPIGHYMHPHDPSGRTALCGAEILGVESFGEFETCFKCQVLYATGDSERLTT